MAVLIIEYENRHRRMTLNGRASIGRTQNNDIVLEHPAVSRIHAVIEAVDGVYLIYDPGSKNGTLVGDELINQPRALEDRDRISIGPAIITFRENDDFDDASHELSETHGGMLVDCECGTKLWIPKEMIGGRGQCQPMWSGWKGTCCRSTPLL